MSLVLTTSDSMRITLGSALNVDYSVHYIDDATDTPGNAKGTYATASTTTILSAPSTGRRLVKSVYINNRDTAPNVVTVDIYNGSTAYRLTKCTLAADDVICLDNSGLKQFTPSQTSQHSVRAYRTSAKTLTHNVETEIDFDGERYDVGGLHDTVTNNGRLTAQLAGKYLIWANINFNANATGLRQVTFKFNAGATVICFAQAVNAGASGYVGLCPVVTHDFAVGDYVRCFAYQNSGGDLAITASGIGNSGLDFGMTRLSA